MPIYDYKCSDCEYETEIIQKFSDEPKTLCPKCNKNSLLKMVSAPSFRLKGGGGMKLILKLEIKKTYHQMIINLQKIQYLTPRKSLNKIRLLNK